MRVEHLRDQPYSNDDILKATTMEVVNTMRDLLHLNPLYGEQLRTLLSLSEWRLGMGCGVLSAQPSARPAAPDPAARRAAAHAAVAERAARRALIAWHPARL